MVEACLACSKVINFDCLEGLTFMLQKLRTINCYPKVGVVYSHPTNNDPTHVGNFQNMVWNDDDDDDDDDDGRCTIDDS